MRIAHCEVFMLTYTKITVTFIFFLFVRTCTFYKNTSQKENLKLKALEHFWCDPKLAEKSF